MDLRLGRQIQWDLFDLRGIDGLWVQARTPIYVAAEVFGGLSQNGTLPIDSPLYALDGTSRSVNPSVSDDSSRPMRINRRWALRCVRLDCATSRPGWPIGERFHRRRTQRLRADHAGTDRQCLRAGLWHHRGTARLFAARTLLQGRLQGFGGFVTTLSAASSTTGMLVCAPHHSLDICAGGISLRRADVRWRLDLERVFVAAISRCPPGV